jgi:hypothetical protein
MNATRVLTKEIDDVISFYSSPLKKIMSAGVENKSFHQRYPFYDVKEYKEVDMFEAGILDTAKGIKML